MRRILVANRGEIACRIIRTLDRLGIESVAVFTDVDRGSLHCDMATVALPLGAARDDGYRSVDRLLEVTRRSGADGVHPGYGFLAEDADFAAAVEDAGLVFLGPTPEQIRRFGAKDVAREAARIAGLALPPGTEAFTDVDAVVAAAPEVGFPLLVKSVAGGGGIGMLTCLEPADLRDVVARAIHQSAQSFGNRAVFLERLVVRARHVEVQVFGDGLGTVVALGERDCSTQRRRQKVLEEAPAPHLADEMRAALARAAVALLEPEKYRSAGTVEFVLDVDTGEFHFLEVNTRLQVEHTVTEATVGVDLVEWMIRAADGDTAFLDSAVPPPRGHAIEARIYAENPAQGFVPSPGLVTEVVWPAGVRVDTWVRTGTEVTPFYDPLLAKIVVHAPTRVDAVDRLHDALARTVVRGIETNVAQLASFVDGEAFREGTVTTSALEHHDHSHRTVDVVVPGNTTVQDLPGRVGLWHVGVPPSGPMDDRSFRLGNRILGNPEGMAGLECTALGPTLRFACDTVICVAGAVVEATCDGTPVAMWEPHPVRAGQTLTVGARRRTGLRTYVLVRGGVDAGEVLGSASTFTLGGFGGHGGRELRTGDVLHLGTPDDATDEPRAVDPALVPTLVSDWDLAVTDGPHAAPDFVTDAGMATFYDAEWRVHHHSSRTGVRLVGPRIEWARPDGGEAGLHPSNVHDTPYTVGAVDFTGDMPIVLGPDGPSLGGFTCPVTVIADDRWKLGQLAPGDRVRFVPVDLAEARARARATDHGLRARRARHHTPARRANPAPTVLAVRPASGDAPQVTYRAQGDRALLVEYGPMVLDFDLRLRAHALATWIAEHATAEVVELTPGIRSLQVQFDHEVHTPSSMAGLLERAEDELPPLDDVVVPSRIVHLPLSWDDPATREAIERYMRVVRDDAPWCPWNIEFIRRVNGLASVDDVRGIVFDAEYLVLGLGDVYLGAPVAVPVDPRHRLVTTKYNPARTWTPENAVGIGGTYLCIYGMEGPGGYQFVGRTVQVWSRYGRGPHVTPEAPWLLRHFDRIRWHPVGADELVELRAEAAAGRLGLRIEDGEFSRAAHRRFLAAHDDGIAAFRTRREAAFASERAHWDEIGELARGDAVDAHATGAPDLAPGDLPDGAFVVEAPLHGCVARLLVSPGDRIAPGDGVVVLEAMKTESTVVSPAGGTVARVLCDEGSLVAAGAPLFVVVVDGELGGWSVGEARALAREEGAAAVAREHVMRRARSGRREAWISTVDDDALLERAAEIDAGLAAGAALPLAGVPFAVKDNIDVAGVPTTAACRDFAYTPALSAPVVDALLGAGALYVGKTNLDQFATGLVGTRSPHFGTCRNPHAPSYIAGGSSSGSAVVVAAGEVPLALGTDTAGSGRVPAANCGVVGLKPTPGVLSTAGVVPAMPSYDCVSVFATTIADGATAFSLLRSGRRGSVRHVTRVGVPFDLDWSGDDRAARCFAHALERIGALGVEVIEVDGAPLWAAGSLLYDSALVAERVAAFGRFVDDHPDAVHPATREIIRRARGYDAAGVFAALDALRSHRNVVDTWWDHVDAIVLPTVARVPTVDEAERDLFAPSLELGRFTSFANPLGMPVVATPAGTRPSGVPFGVSFTGPAGADEALLSLARWFERGRPAVEVHPAPDRLPIVVVGAHLSGEPLNHQLVDLGGRLVASTTTAAEYRLFALDTSPPKPGLVRAPGGGVAIEVEVWELDAAGFGSFVAGIPAPLGIGKVVLADGSETSGFLCESHAVAAAEDITAYGGWRAFLAGRER